jgi:hypothetical protein
LKNWQLADLPGQGQHSKAAAADVDMISSGSAFYFKTPQVLQHVCRTN